MEPHRQPHSSPGRCRLAVPARALLTIGLLAAGCSATVDSAAPSPPVSEGQEAPVVSTPLAPSNGSEKTGPTPGADPVPLNFTPIGDSIYQTAGTAGLDVTRYDLAIDLTDGGFSATAIIDLSFSGPEGEAIALDLASQDVSEVSVNGESVGFSHEEGKLVFLVDVGASRVTIAYSGYPVFASPTAGLPTGWARRPWGSIVTGAPDGARTWFPVNDHPSDKATYSISVAVDNGFTVAGPGPLIEPVDNVFRFEPRDPITPAMVSIVVGDLKVTETTGASGVPIRIALPTDQHAGLVPLIADLDSMIEEMEQLVGPYPFDSYGIAATDFRTYTSTAQSLSIFQLEALLDDAAQAHELAHQWFGGNVSIAQWEDNWLNEGFATWFEYRSLEPDMSLLIKDILRPPPGGFGPIVATRPDNIFDETIFLRGAMTLEVLRRTIGDESFVELLHEWTEHFGGTNALTQDFLDLVGELAGPDAEALVHAWVYDETMPAIPDTN